MWHLGAWAALFPGVEGCFAGCSDEPCFGDMPAWLLLLRAGCHRLPELNYFTPFEPVSCY